jgi:hypothetical protein
MEMAIVCITNVRAKAARAAGDALSAPILNCQHDKAKRDYQWSLYWFNSIYGHADCCASRHFWAANPILLLFPDRAGTTNCLQHDSESNIHGDSHVSCAVFA